MAPIRLVIVGRQRAVPSLCCAELYNIYVVAGWSAWMLLLPNVWRYAYRESISGHAHVTPLLLTTYSGIYSTWYVHFHSCSGYNSRIIRAGLFGFASKFVKGCVCIQHTADIYSTSRKSCTAVASSRKENRVPQAGLRVSRGKG